MKTGPAAEAVLDGPLRPVPLTGLGQKTGLNGSFSAWAFTKTPRTILAHRRKGPFRTPPRHPSSFSLGKQFSENSIVKKRLSRVLDGMQNTSEERARTTQSGIYAVVRVFSYDRVLRKETKLIKKLIVFLQGFLFVHFSDKLQRV